MDTELELSPEFPSPGLYDDVHKHKPRKACTKLPAGLAENLLIWCQCRRAFHSTANPWR